MDVMLLCFGFRQVLTSYVFLVTAKKRWEWTPFVYVAPRQTTRSASQQANNNGPDHLPASEQIHPHLLEALLKCTLWIPSVFYTDVIVLFSYWLFKDIDWQWHDWNYFTFRIFARPSGFHIFFFILGKFLSTITSLLPFVLSIICFNSKQLSLIVDHKIILLNKD